MIYIEKADMSINGPIGPPVQQSGGSVGLVNGGSTAVQFPSRTIPADAIYPTYTYITLGEYSAPAGWPVGVLNDSTNAPTNAIPTKIFITQAEYQANRNSIYPPLPTPQAVGSPTNNNAVPSAGGGTTPDDYDPLDTRLIFIADNSEQGVPRGIMSYTSNPSLVAPLVEGFVYSKNNVRSTEGTPEPFVVQDPKYGREEIYNDPGVEQFIGVPALMSNMTYVGLIASGGKTNVKDIIDRENQPRWYDHTSGLNKKNQDGNVVSASQDLTVSDLIKWSETNKRFPYRYQDFVFLKYWKKIPLNYMITLRRYTRPVIDNVTSEFDGEYTGNKEIKLRSAVHAVTFLGEEAGNKISTILGPIEAGLKWKDIKADVWEVNTSGEPATADSPFPDLAKALGFLTKGPVGPKDTPAPMTPPDPYENGPYANKIIGPVTVIDRVKGRERGIEFKHTINLQFEYVARSIGGINSKAAMLDILANLMILTFNSASFWGGMNRYMPYAAGGAKAPFLGGEEGRKAWLNGNPAEFFNAVSKQFSGALDNIGDLFNKVLSDPIAGLKQVASGAMSNYMKMNTTAGRMQVTGIHSLLTGNPVGEWHITVGNPINPMMMIGNLICTNIKIEFNDELGPDDFPTELKATITLEHGMPRDRDGIESMFNKGGGRIYSLPPKMNENDLFPSNSQTAVDDPTGGAKPNTGAGTKSDANTRPPSPATGNPLLGDPTVFDKIGNTFRNSTVPSVSAVSISVYNHGMATYNSVKNK